ncbi:MAG TPA: uracil-DNA glycosylase family protein [Chitinophaga sp.]
MTFGEKVIDFNIHLHFEGRLPAGIRMMYPFGEGQEARHIMEQFYHKFYNDNGPRRMLIGINPGRFGSGVTGVPFTDTKRLTEKAGISFRGGLQTHEPSSVFVHNMIDAYGGLKQFCRRFYFTSMCPLGFVMDKGNGKEVNYNYYDTKALTNLVYDFMITKLKEQLAWGIDRQVGYCLGTGKNAAFVMQVNERYKFFDQLVPLEHPRFIMQYRSKYQQAYIDKYLAALCL